MVRARCSEITRPAWYLARGEVPRAHELLGFADGTAREIGDDPEPLVAACPDLPLLTMHCG
jgi:hypothetical protein